MTTPNKKLGEYFFFLALSGPQVMTVCSPSELTHPYAIIPSYSVGQL